MAEITHCRDEGCIVAYMTGTGIDGCILQAARSGTLVPLDGDDTVFPSREAAQAFAIERGYVHAYEILRDDAGRFLRLQRLEG